MGGLNRVSLKKLSAKFRGKVRPVVSRGHITPDQLIIEQFE